MQRSNLFRNQRFDDACDHRARLCYQHILLVHLLRPADTPEGGRGSGESGGKGRKGGKEEGREEGENAWSGRIGSKGRNVRGEL